MENIIKKAEAGDANSQNYLGYCYSKGEGVPQSHEKAVEWYTKAAEQGHATAQTNLGNCNYDGRGVPKSFEKAREWYEKAVAQGDEGGQFKLGWLYYTGEGVEQNYVKARDLWQLSAAQGDANAMFNLAIMNYHGQGIEIDKESAFIWFKKASLHGYVGATRNVGVCFENGYGIQKNLKQALIWYKKAIAQGDSSAKKDLEYLEKMIKENTVRIQDADFGELVNEGDNWEAKTTAVFYGNEGNLLIEMEGSAKDEITDAQRKAYAEYKEKEDIFFNVYINPSNGELLPKTLYIDREGNYLWRCTNSTSNKITVITLAYVEVHDADFGDLRNLGDGSWRGKTTANFNDEGELAIELEGSAKDKITDAQRKAYAEYKAKDNDFYKATINKAKEVFSGANQKKNNEIIPRRLYIDKQGNYGWVCNKEWDKRSITAILSDGDVQFTYNSVLYNYAEIIENRTKKEWHTGDTAYVNLFGMLEPLCVSRASYEFEKDENQEIREGKLTDREVELLLWLTNELNTADIADDVLEYCNDCYDGVCYYDEEKGEYVDCEPIEKLDLINELDIRKIYLKTQHADRNDHLPDISLAGECECDPDHGIAICFRDKKLIEIGSEDFGF